MESIREKILKTFQTIDQFKYATWEPSVFDREDFIRDVKEALNYYCPNHTISDVLFNQLVDLNGSGVVKICGYNHPYEIADIFWTMEQIVRGEVKEKPFKKRNSLVANKNIYHTHHSQTFYSMMNCIRYFKQHYKNDKSILERLAQLKAGYPNRDNHMEIFANEVGVLVASVQKTGIAQMNPSFSL